MLESHAANTHSQPTRVPTTRGKGPSALTFVHPASPFTAAKPATNRAEDFDALADLFLSELPPVTIAAANSNARRDRSGGPSQEARTPLPEQPAAHNLPVAKELLVATGLTNHHTPQPAKSSSSARIEAVLLGHLPVYAAAWVGQYARMRAAQLGGPVALLRVTGQWVRVELTGLAPQAATRFVETGDLMAALATATGSNRGQAAAHGVLLCATASDEQRLVSAPAVQDITLLTGADEASTVAAYRVIKTIAHATAVSPHPTGPAQVATNTPEFRPGFRLVVAGCDQPAASTIWRRLADAARTFLGLELELAGSMPQICGSEPATLLYDGPLTDSIADMLEMVQSCQRPAATLTTLTSLTAAPITRKQPIANDVVDDAETDDFFDAAADEADRIETARAVEALAAFSARTAPAMPAVALVPLVPVKLESTVRSAHAAAPISAAANLSPPAHAAAAINSPNWLSTLGLTSLGLPCPAAPAALIGRCDHGRLHIAALGGLTQAEHESAIVSLLRASAWCCEHRDMLCHLIGDGLIKDAATVGKPVLHLLSSSGPLARQSCIAGIDVSLLAPVPTGATCVAVSLTRSH